MSRTILHCDCNSFFASVECFFNPQLKNVPMAVCGDPEHRHGIILAKNELAKAKGVVTAETIWSAKEKCPELVLVKPHYSHYREFSKRVNEIYLRYTDFVEPFGIDESWLDVTNSIKIFGSGKEIAEKIRKEVREEIGITVSIGVSFNKVFAKLGSDYKKPDAVTVIDESNFKDIVFPLDVSTLLYVGKRSTDALLDLGVRTIGDLAHFNKDILTKKFGKMGTMLSLYANGNDNSPVKKWGEQEELKSIGNGMTFQRDLVDENDIKTAVTALADIVSERMRKHAVKCTTISVQIKTPNFKSYQKQKALDFSTDISSEIRETAIEIILGFWNVNSPIRAITVTGTNLVSADDERQVSLFGDDTDYQRLTNIDKAMDKIRKKYGHSSIKFASIVQNDLGIDNYKEEE